MHYQHAVTCECKNQSRESFCIHTQYYTIDKDTWGIYTEQVIWTVDQFFLYIELIANQWHTAYQINDQWWLVLPMKFVFDSLDGNLQHQKCVSFFASEDVNSIPWNVVFDREFQKIGLWKNMHNNIFLYLFIFLLWGRVLLGSLSYPLFPCCKWPALVSQVPRTTGMCHYTWLNVCIFSLFFQILLKLFIHFMCIGIFALHACLCKGVKSNRQL